MLIGAIDELKTAPRGYPKDHPRIELIRRKGLMASRELGAPKWLYTKQAAAKIRQVWDGAAEMNAGLETGPRTSKTKSTPALLSLSIADSCCSQIGVSHGRTISSATS